MTFSLTDALVQAAESGRGLTFIEGDKDERAVSYAALLDRSRRLLTGFRERGLASGNELVFQLETNEEYIAVFCACLLGGVIPVPVSVATNISEARKLRTIWETLNCPFLIAEGRLARRLKDNPAFEEELADIFAATDRLILTEELSLDREPAVIRRANEDELAYIQFSSGSTGTPKGVMLTHRNLVINVRDMIAGGAITKEDSTLSWLPLTHDLGLIGFFLTPLLLGIDCYLMPTSLFIRRPSLWLKKAYEHRATITASPNFGYSYFLKRFKPKEAEEWQLSSIRLIVNGAEPISYDLAQRFLQEMAPYGLRQRCMFTVYGMAEACLGVAFPIPGQPVRAVHCHRSFLAPGQRVRLLATGAEGGVTFVEEGAALPQVSIRICDDEDNVLEEGIVGHIQITGGNVTAGYYNNQAATEEAFTEDGWLRTGDVGFFLGGSLVVTGRSKDILFVNGQNYYSHDLERMTGALDGIETAEVAIAGLFDPGLARDIIVAFVTYRGDEESFWPVAGAISASLLEQCGVSLDDIVPVRKIPKTTSGKKQRYLLVEDYIKGALGGSFPRTRHGLERNASAKEQEGPATPKERLLLKVWRQVLGTEEIGVTDSFFRVGGNSLFATAMVSRVQALGYELPLTAVFSSPTIRELAEMLVPARGNALPPLKPAPEREKYPLASGQRRIYIQERLQPSSTSYNIPVAVLIEGKLEYGQAAAALETMIRHHDILRTFIAEEDGIPYQIIRPFVSLTFAERTIREEEIAAATTAFIRPFECHRPPLFRVGLYRIAENRQLFLLDMHHLISDGSTVALFMKQLLQLCAGEAPSLPSLQYKDYAVWEEEQGGGRRAVVHREYWLERFSGSVPRLNMPHDFVRPTAQSFRGDRVHFAVEPRLAGKIRLLADRCGATPYMVFMTAYWLMLHSFSGQTDIVIGSPAACRTLPGTEDMLGMFVNMIPVRVAIEGQAGVIDLLGSVRTAALEAFEHQEYPFEELVESLGGTQKLGEQPLFSAAFVLQNFALPSCRDITYTVMDVNTGTAQYDLLLSLLEENGDWKGQLEYSADLYRRETAETMLSRYLLIMDRMLEQPDLTIARVTDEPDTGAAAREAAAGSGDDAIFEF